MIYIIHSLNILQVVERLVLALLLLWHVAQTLLVGLYQSLSDLRSAGRVPAVLHAVLALALRQRSQLSHKPKHKVQRHLQTQINGQLSIS